MSQSAQDAASEVDQQAETFEERADYVSEEVLRTGTALGDFFDGVHRALVAQGLTLIVGPRGCGKTHMMRFTWLECCENQQLPFAIYASFNRYLRLEPLLRARPDALTLFQAWVLGRIILAADDAVSRTAKETKTNTLLSDYLRIDRDALQALVTKLERGIALRSDEEEIAQHISIEGVSDAISYTAVRLGRRRAILLLDDAALTLTPEYLIEFFDIVRVLKRGDVSPKASVYPGTTEYGPRFHATHEGRIVPVWLSVEQQSYGSSMNSIAERRFPEAMQLTREIREVLQFAAFGVPRAYLTMLREFSSGEFSTGQQGLNRVVQQHSEARLEEYRSLSLKMPRLATLVRTGEEFYKAIINQLRDENDRLAETDEKQILLGLPSEMKPMPSRMVNLLIEAGLLYEHDRVSHGPDRVYRRFTPHLASLIAARAFAGKSRGGSPRQILDFLTRRSAKHPLRRSLGNLVGADYLASLRLNLPPCQSCHTPRLNESQRFCHHCGQKLLDDSTFTHCMQLELKVVPGLTFYQIGQMQNRQIRTIGDLLSIQDPGTELRKIPWVGRARADRILAKVEAYVDEFLT